MTEFDLERVAYMRVLLVIAGGHENPRRLAQEVLESRTGVTDEILDSPMWKPGSDLAYYVSSERAEGRENPVRVDRHDFKVEELPSATMKEHVQHNFQNGLLYCVCHYCVSAARVRELANAPTPEQTS